MSNNVELLVNKIKELSQSYYEGHPQVSDQFFDDLIDQLKELDPNNPILVTPGWGYDPQKVSTSKAKVSHNYGVVSGISNKVRVTSSISPDYVGGVMSDKLDGLSAIAEYENGIFVRGVTRGNGSVGIDITDKLATRLPHKLKDTTFSGAIRGELVISYDNWNKVLEYNPDAEIRNYAAGILNRNEITEELALVDFVPYKIQGVKNSSSTVDLSSVKSIKSWIASQFTNSCPFYDIESIPSDEELLKFYESEMTKKYPTDGIVFTQDKVNFSWKFDKSLGISEYTELAYKFKSDTEEFLVDSISWNLTRRGYLIPVLNLNTKHLAGANISRCTAFNAQFVEDNQIGPGSIVEIERSGEVIPDIQKVVVESTECKLPEVCPSCGSKLVRVGVNLKCVSSSCKSQSRSSILHWISWLGDPEEGLGNSAINKLLDFFNIEDISDLYSKLNSSQDFSSIEGIGSVNNTRIQNMIKKLNSPQNPEYFLVACNIPGVAGNRAKMIVQSKILNDILLRESDEVIRNKLYSLKGVGESLVESVMNNLSVIREYASYITLESLVPPASQSVESTKLVSVTGHLNSMSRSKFGEYISKYGYEITSKVKDAMYLITNESKHSAKYNSAIANNVKIITEDEFLAILNNTSNS